MVNMKKIKLIKFLSGELIICKHYNKLSTKLIIFITKKTAPVAQPGLLIHE